MCGIIGYLGKKDAVRLILDGLKMLEYRGYDSSGLAAILNGSIKVVKQQGRLSELEKSVLADPFESHIGIGHTRWATHGEPSDVNSHPHLGSRSHIAIVHNGIIENYAEIKEQLINQGVQFASKTDSEVIAQLAEQLYEGDLLQTVVRLAKVLKGTYALGILCLDEPEIIVAIRKDNPLIVGVAEHGNFIASDVSAFIGHTNNVYYMNDGEIAVLKPGSVEFFDSDCQPLQKQIETVDINLESVNKGGYPHYMLKEIYEQPRVLKESIESVYTGGKNADALAALDIRNFNRIVITACGSAYNAGVVARYVFEQLLRMHVEVELASEFRYKDPIVDAQTLVILVSQSGETTDTIAALREAKRRGATTLGIVNVVGSTVARETDSCIYTLAGPEIAVATTKAFSAQLAILYQLALHFSTQLNTIDGEKREHLQAELARLPELAAELLELDSELRRLALTAATSKSIFFIGRNLDYAIALEGSLKLKEISYIHSEAYAGGELKHGTISLIEPGTLVVVLANCSQLYDKIISNAEQVVSRGAQVLLISSLPNATAGTATTLIGLPRCHELFSPSLAVIAMQILSYYVADIKGLDIDKPRNLAKSVTVE